MRWKHDYEKLSGKGFESKRLMVNSVTPCEPHPLALCLSALEE